MARPYLTLWIWELERLAESVWKNPTRLAEIAHELRFRRSQRAARLALKVTRRLHRLQGDPAPGIFQKLAQSLQTLLGP